MKKTINKILLLPFLVLLVTFTGCFNLYSKEEVSIVIDESFFSDFNVTDNVVGVNCIVTLKNSHSRDIKVRLTAIMQKDVKLGLLKNARLPGHNRDDSLGYFILKASSTSTFDVVFMGDYNGNYQKTDRMLPEIAIDIYDD